MPPVYKITPKGREFLDTFRKAGQNAVTTREIKEWASRHGFAPSTIQNCRYQQIGWWEEFEAIKKQHSLDRKTAVMQKRKGKEPKHPNKHMLVGAQDMFLKHWEKTGSRIEALAEAGIRWSQVKRWLKDDKYFTAQYKEVMDTSMIEIEDSLMTAARSGKVNAQTKVLEAYSDKWATKIKHQHNIAGNVIFTQETTAIAADTWASITEAEVVDAEEGPKLLPS